MRSQDIRIPEPCHADWDGMRPEEKGRFCSSCSKKVHDLSAMTRDEAKGFLRRNACGDVCISYEHHEDGTLVFREPEPRPAPVVRLARLRRPRSVAAAVAGAGVAMTLAACAPHGETPVRSYSAAETPVFREPSVVIPQESEPVRAPEPVPVVEEEPCDPAVEPTETVEPERPRVKGRVKRPSSERVIHRTAGKPIMPRVKGDMAYVDPDAL